MNNIIGLRIKELRNKEKMTQIDFSTKIGIDNSQLSKIEKGKLMPTLQQLMEISSIFNTSIDWLTGNESFKNDTKKAFSQNISGNNNTIAGNDMTIDNNSRATIEALTKEIKELNNRILEKDKQINKLINLIDKLQ